VLPKIPKVQQAWEGQVAAVVAGAASSGAPDQLAPSAAAQVGKLVVLYIWLFVFSRLLDFIVNGFKIGVRPGGQKCLIRVWYGWLMRCACDSNHV
jgi:hypothetical protein